MGRIEGDVTVMSLTDLVIWLANRGVSGTLELRNGDVEKTFDVDAGMVVRAASDDPREYFGQILLHFGLLTEDQLQRAFDTQRETTVLLGRILVMIGIVPEEQVIQCLRVKISESLLDAFKWKRGSFRFIDEREARDAPQIEVAVPLVDLHAEGLTRDEVWSRFERVFPSPRHYAAVDEAKISGSGSPESLDARIIELCRAGLNIEEMTLELHATDYQLAAALLGLYDAQVLMPREPASILPRPSSSSERWASVTASGLGRDEVPRLVKEIDAETRQALSAKQRYILARIDGKRTIRSITQVSPMHDLEALEIIKNFEREGLVRYSSLPLRS